MKAVSVLLLLCLPAMVLAQEPINRPLTESQALQREAEASQRRVEALDDATREAVQRYRQALLQRELLVDYNARLAEMVSSQQTELQRLQSQLDSIEGTQQSLLPLMQRMLDTLEQFIALDLPFQMQERTERVEQLRVLMQRADASVAEKFRRLIEAYQIESDYGRTLEAWRGTLDEDQQSRLVDFLRVGRLMLFYQTLDGREQGVWDPQSGAWIGLPSSYRRTLEQGLNIARQQQTPVMLRLPLPPVTELRGAE